MRPVSVENFNKWVLSSPSKESKEFRIFMTRAGFTFHWRRVEYGSDTAVENYTLGVITHVADNMFRELHK